MEPEIRTFTEEKHGGRYLSQFPHNAAKKAASQLFKKGETGKKKITLRETTRGSSGKIYHYNVKRIRSPVTITRRDGF